VSAVGMFGGDLFKAKTSAYRHMPSQGGLRHTQELQLRDAGEIAHDDGLAEARMRGVLTAVLYKEEELGRAKVGVGWQGGICSVPSPWRCRWCGDGSGGAGGGLVEVIVGGAIHWQSSGHSAHAMPCNAPRCFPTPVHHTDCTPTAAFLNHLRRLRRLRRLLRRLQTEAEKCLKLYEAALAERWDEQREVWAVMDLLAQILADRGETEASMATMRQSCEAKGKVLGDESLEIADVLMGNAMIMFREEVRVRCGAVRCGAVRCGAVRCGAVRCGALGVVDRYR
jgi:hypothetical protein